MLICRVACTGGWLVQLLFGFVFSSSRYSQGVKAFVISKSLSSRSVNLPFRWPSNELKSGTILGLVTELSVPASKNINYSQHGERVTDPRKKDATSKTGNDSKCVLSMNVWIH